MINSREYAFGAHDRPGLTGVYHTTPGLPPPGAAHRLEIFHGFTILTATEIDQVIKDVSRRFLGRDWNLLERNCNHFTSYLCEELTGVEAPGWLNRAARFGVKVPCLLPAEAVRAPGAEEGEVLEEEDESDEEAHMLGRHRSGHDSFLVDDHNDSSSEEEEPRAGGGSQYTSDDDDDRRPLQPQKHGHTLKPPDGRRESERGTNHDRDAAKRGRTARQRDVRDTDGRRVPVSERAPVR